MAAKELSRTPDHARAAIIVQIDDGHGYVSPFTCYVLQVDDVEAAIKKAIQDAGERGDATAAKMQGLMV